MVSKCRDFYVNRSGAFLLKALVVSRGTHCRDSDTPAVLGMAGGQELRRSQWLLSKKPDPRRPGFAAGPSNRPLSPLRLGGLLTSGGVRRAGVGLPKRIHCAFR